MAQPSEPGRRAAYQPIQESWAERLIREAIERGEFDHLPGAGRPLDLGPIDGPADPDWWIRAKLRRENLDASGALPTALLLRKEAERFPESLRDLTTEAQVREVLEDYNRRVKLDRLRPAVGGLPPLLARTVDVESLLTQWRAMRQGDGRPD
jgi:hypothetical protein